MRGLTREQWAEKLAAIGSYIKAKGAEITVEVIGSWPAIESGMPGRTSEDLDIWTPNSQFDAALFREACINAGLDFNPIGETNRPYIQLVRPGITQVPEHEPERAAIFGGLIVVTPPPAALIASKLVRATDKDVHDVIFLKQKYRVSTKEVTDFAQAIGNKMARDAAIENIVYLEFYNAGSKRTRTHRNKRSRGKKK